MSLCEQVMLSGYGRRTNCDLNARRRGSRMAAFRRMGRPAYSWETTLNPITISTHDMGAPQDALPAPTAREGRGAGRKAIIAAAAGNALEWYDFTVYALFAVYIGQNFFQDDNPSVQLMVSFLAFGLGFVARPLGALIIGSFGDRAGRKAALSLTIMLMAAGTLLIAIAPPYAAIGVGGPLLIVFGRVLQGFSAGGEVGGATAFLVEHAPPGRRGEYASWLQASMGVSNLLAAGVATLVAFALSEAQIGSWGWRIPFILGLAIAPVGLWMRRSLDETPAFQEEQRRQAREGAPAKAPMLEVVRRHPRELALGLGLCVLWAVGPYALIIYMPIYVQKSMGFSSSQAFTAALVGNLFLVAGCLGSGRLSDRLGRRKVLAGGAVLILCSVYPLLAWLQATHSTAALVVVQSVLCLLVAVYVGTAPSALSEIFPTAVRSSGMSLSYNAAVTVLGGFAPAILTWMSYNMQISFAPALYAMAACAVALVTLTFGWRAGTGRPDACGGA